MCVYPFLALLFQESKRRKEENDRECLRMMRSHQKVEEGRSSMEKEHQEAYMSPLDKKGPE
jgi:hypothetical protein